MPSAVELDDDTAASATAAALFMGSFIWPLASAIELCRLCRFCKLDRPERFERFGRFDKFGKFDISFFSEGVGLGPCRFQQTTAVVVIAPGLTYQPTGDF